MIMDQKISKCFNQLLNNFKTLGLHSQIFLDGNVKGCQKKV